MVGGPGTAGMSETCRSNTQTFNLPDLQASLQHHSTERQQKKTEVLAYRSSEQQKTQNPIHIFANHIHRWFEI